VRSYASLSRRGDFAAIHRRGRRIPAGPLTFLVRPGRGGRSRLGIAVPRAVGKAVVRNRIRRRLQNAFDRTNFGAAGLDVVVIVRPEAAAAPFRSFLANVERALGAAR
jgi:ribonuclease P protein component